MDVATGETPVPHDLALAWSATFSKLQKVKPRYAKIRFLKWQFFI